MLIQLKNKGDTMEKSISKVAYKVGTFLEDVANDKIFEVKNCVNHLLYDNHFILDLKEVEQNKSLKFIEDLKSAVSSIKIHDKDAFMLENIISQLEDTIK